MLPWKTLWHCAPRIAGRSIQLQQQRQLCLHYPDGAVSVSANSHHQLPHMAAAAAALSLMDVLLGSSHSVVTTSISSLLQDLSNGIWFAVPKSKHSKSRKRKKTTAQKRLPLQKNIVLDPQTGEVTLQHKLPPNWKEYLLPPSAASPKLDWCIMIF